MARFPTTSELRREITGFAVAYAAFVEARIADDQNSALVWSRVTLTNAAALGITDAEFPPLISCRNRVEAAKREREEA